MKPTTLTAIFLCCSITVCCQSALDTSESSNDASATLEPPPAAPALEPQGSASSDTPWPTVSGDSTPEALAQQLLADVVASLPRDPLTLRGQITVRRPRGIVVQELAFEALVGWGWDPPAVRYVVSDTFGTERERLTVRGIDLDAPRLEYAAGDPPVSARAPSLFQRVQGTDITWADLSFWFLWWEPEAVVGSDHVRGRTCHIVDVRAPAGRDDGSRPYARVRLWIDKKFCLLMQAEGYDSGGRVIRRLWVKSLKKIDERWMVKDIEVESVPAVHRTRVRIREVASGTSS